MHREETVMAQDIENLMVRNDYWQDNYGVPEEDEEDIRTCPVCECDVHREDMRFTYDCHGIPFRLVCDNCYDTIMDEKGYDGEYYTSADENIEPEDYY